MTSCAESLQGIGLRFSVTLVTNFSWRRTHDCPIICSDGRRLLIQRLLQLDVIEGKVQLVDASSIRAVEEYVDISGLILNPRDLDALYTLKTCRDLRTYAKGFVEVVHGFRNEPDARRKLLELMREAIAKSEVAANAKGIFNSSSTVLSFLGLVPIVGTAAGVVGIGTDWGPEWQRKHREGRSGTNCRP